MFLKQRSLSGIRWRESLKQQTVSNTMTYFQFQRRALHSQRLAVLSDSNTVNAVEDSLMKENYRPFSNSSCITRELINLYGMKNNVSTVKPFTHQSLRPMTMIKWACINAFPSLYHALIPTQNPSG